MTDPTGQSYVTAFGLALKSVETIKNLVTTPDAKKQAAELFEIILSGQASALEESVKQRALLQSVRDLEEKLTRFETWSREKKRYSLMQPAPGFFAFALKQSASDGEPPHWICATCYEDGNKSIIQRSPVEAGRENLYSCFRCKSKFQTYHKNEPQYAD